MGDINQLTFARKHRDLFRGPYLEVGSRDYGSTQNLREVFSDGEFVGIDMLEGQGVDQVLDLTLPFEQISAALGGRRFGSVFCLSVMEHCDQPFAMGDAITRLLEPGGAVYISVPHAWMFHGYPSDYWRFTHEGIKKLFPELTFDMSIARWSTDVVGEYHPIDEEISRIHLSSSWQRRRHGGGRALGASLLKAGGALGLWGWLTRHRYVLPPTMIDMIGVKVG